MDKIEIELLPAEEKEIRLICDKLSQIMRDELRKKNFKRYEEIVPFTFSIIMTLILDNFILISDMGYTKREEKLRSFILLLEDFTDNLTNKVCIIKKINFH